MQGPGNPTRRKQQRALIALLVFVITAAVGGELALRGRYDKIGHITGVSEWEQGEWEGLTYYWDEYHPRLGWVNRPGYRSDERVPFQLAINNQGLRGTHDYGETAPAGKQRVLMLGDSCVFGEEVGDGETVPAWLEKQLTGVEVLNMGVHGYGFGQMVLQLEEQGFALHPDHVVVVLLLPEDMSRDPLTEFVHGKPAFAVVDHELQIHNVPVPMASEQSWLLRNSFAAAWLWGRPQERIKPDTVREHLPLLDALLRRLAEQCMSRDIPFTVVGIVIGGMNPKRLAVAGAVSDHMAASRIDWLDLVDPLQQAYAFEGESLIAPHGHWLGRANRLIAGWIAQHLVRSHADWTLAATDSNAPK